MNNNVKQISVSLSNGTMGELEISESFINKLLAAGYSADDLSDGQKLLHIICQFAANAKVSTEA
jgi:hypothetical protein